jgi:hypothetical protein
MKANKEIGYDRETKDFAGFLDGQYIGSFEKRADAQAELDRLALEQAKGR